MRARQESCCFTGHRPTKLPWRFREDDPRCIVLKQRIADAVDMAYEEGYRHFLCGMALGCDQYFCEAVLALREIHSDVTVEAAIPCPSQPDGWAEKDRQRWRRLVDACDYETLVQDHYDAQCMLRRNRYMVNHASLLIAVYDGCGGGTRHTMEYAMRQKVNIVDIPPV